MTRRSLAALALVCVAVPLAAQTSGTQKPPERAIRRDIPRTDMIRRAYAAGTRDTTGRPGAKYWQLWMDYTINARFDAPASTVSGRERIVLHNNSDSAMTSVVLRLDQNLFAANVPRAEVVTEITDGMKVTHLAVDGQPVDLAPPAAGRGGGGRGGRGATATPPGTSFVTGLGLTSARITLAKPIAAHGTGTIDADW
ncbi:MAG: M1 family peptidase, partial [Gemmatimonadaceae bacterium]